MRHPAAPRAHGIRVARAMASPAEVPEVAEAKAPAEAVKARHPDVRAAMARIELRNEAERAAASPAADSALGAAKAEYEAIFGKWPRTHGKTISRKERDGSQLNASSLVYGAPTRRPRRAATLRARA